MPSTVFLKLPAEIRHAVYKRVFAGAILSIDVTMDATDMLTTNKLTIKRTKFAPCVVNAAVLETCSTINVEAFPIMAEAITLAIHFKDIFGMTGLNLTKLTNLSYTPSFLSRIFRFTTKLTYSHYYWNRYCFGAAAFANLKEICIRTSRLLALGSNDLPHLNELALSETTDAASTLASAARDEIMFDDSWSDLRELVETRDRKFRIYLQADADYDHHRHMCTAAPEVCLCRRQEYPDGVQLGLVRTRHLRFEHGD